MAQKKDEDSGLLQELEEILKEIEAGERKLADVKKEKKELEDQIAELNATHKDLTDKISVIEQQEKIPIKMPKPARKQFLN